MHQLPMFGITLIVTDIQRNERDVAFSLRLAGTHRVWTLLVDQKDEMIETLSRPGAVLALVELASVSQVEIRGRF